MFGIHRAFKLFSLISLAIFVLTVQKSDAGNVNIQMTDVSRLMELPVGSILRGAPVSRLKRPESLMELHKNGRPTVLLVYTSSDPRSREIATLIRYLSLEFQGKIDFYAFEMKQEMGSGTPSRNAREILGLERVPATLFYEKDNDPRPTGGISAPTLKEYRSPGRLFWKTCYSAAARYLKKGLLN